YEAEQISLNRCVALKVLPFASTLNPKHLQRFKNEALAAAHLHHTNIVPVFSVGCERGVHYYAMQYIEGQTLAEVIHELRVRARLECEEPDAARGAETAPYVQGALISPAPGGARSRASPAGAAKATHPAVDTTVRAQAALS